MRFTPEDISLLVGQRYAGHLRPIQDRNPNAREEDDYLGERQ